MKPNYRLAVLTAETDIFSEDWTDVDEHAHTPIGGNRYAVRNPAGVLLWRNIPYSKALEKVQRLRRTTSPRVR